MLCKPCGVHTFYLDFLGKRHERLISDHKKQGDRNHDNEDRDHNADTLKRALIKIARELQTQR